MVIQFQINLVVELTENYSILKGKKKKKKQVSHINYPSFHINNKPYTLHD